MIAQRPKSSYPFPQIDREQAQRQLQYLNHKDVAEAKPRLFYHSDDLRKHNDKGRKLDRLNWKELENYQKDGRGVYVVVNGAGGGGHEDKDIVQCCAIFCEWDDRPVEDQLMHWETIGFLEPTFTVYSGDKSAQPYWVFDKPITIEQWRELQLLLIEVMGADPSNKNPSRVFRLAGGWHIKPGREPVRSEIVQESGEKYSYSEVRRELLRLHCLQHPVVSVQSEQTPVPQAEIRSRSAHAAPQYQRYEDIQIPVTEAIPLEVCLSKDSRTLIASGISQGGRNTNGAKLARDLIGTASHLQTIGQRCDGDPRQMLNEYANHCTPPLPGKEVESIWKSAEKDRPGPSCKAEGVEACIRGWYWNNYVKPNQATRNGSDRHGNRDRSGRGFGGDDSDDSGGTQPPITAVSLCDRIREIINRYEQESLQVNALMDLASATGRTYSEISQLARIIRSEGELADEVIEAVKSFRGILNSCRKRLDIDRYLEPALARALIAKASAMPTAPEYLFNTLLAASASRIGTAARVIINPEGGYKQPCIIWTANVSHSGQAKTPPQQEIINPLEAMEAEASVLYDSQVEDYQQDGAENARPPVRQRRILNNVTSSTKIRLHGQNPRGLLEYLDELVADYLRLNQYKSGKGDDLQLELSFWNGSAVSYDRADIQLFLQRTALSKTGTYQWDTLARLMSDEVNFIASGYSARFLYCSILDAPPRYLDLLSPGGDNTLAQTLGWLYGELENRPEVDYLLSHEAKVLFQGWNHALVNAEIEESHYGLSLVYAKIEANTARIALWLHIVNAVLRGEKPAPFISGGTMQHAIEIASFYLWQHKLIHAHNSPTRKLEGIFLKVQTPAEKFFVKCGRGVGASFLKTRINALKGWVVEKIRANVFKALAAAGHGRIEGEAAEMLYVPTNTVLENVPPDASARGHGRGEQTCRQTPGANTQGVDVQSSGFMSAVVSPFPLTDAVGEIGAIGDELVEPPIAENNISPGIQAPIGAIGALFTPESSSSDIDVAMELGSDPPLKHQFTNHEVETLVNTELEAVGATTNPAPIPPTEPPQSSTPQEMAALILQCQTWVELAQAVGQNTQKLVKAANRLTTEQRQGLTSLLAAHLCQQPEHLNQLAWVPVKLRDRTLERLTFTIRRIGGAANVLDACWESIIGCKFVSVEQIGTRNEKWVFQAKEGNWLAVFGVDAIEAIACGAA